MGKVRWRKMLVASAFGAIVGVALGLLLKHQHLGNAFATMVAVLISWICFSHLGSFEQEAR